MNSDHFSAEFGALTHEEQATVTGGDWSLGYVLGYTAGCMALALEYDYNLIKKLF